MPTAMEIAIFRIVEQALQNVVTHASATETQIVLDFTELGVNLEIQDNGRGFVYGDTLRENKANHLGLVSMRERVRNLNGSMEVYSKPGRGTLLRFFFPAQSEERTMLPEQIRSGSPMYS
jgi:signal transduction histidine kinase